ncbi:hypothetical protein OAV76_03125 [Schleiferiaceae bacterium]|nr:hypothetical protein [Schleiferiaceae bacterium]
MSRHLAILLFFISLGLSAQTWTSTVVSDPWDGDYNIAYTRGYGGESPYTNPTLRIENTKKGINIYIKDLGYTGCSANRLDLIFDNKRKYSAKGNSSTTNDALFIDRGFYTYESKKLLTLYHLLDELTKSSSLKIRFINDCSVNVFSFNLSGSSGAIYKAVGKNLITEKVVYYDTRFERANARQDSLINYKKIIQNKNDSIKSTLESQDEIVNAFILNPISLENSTEGIKFEDVTEIRHLIKKELSFFLDDYGDIVRLCLKESSPGYFRLYGDFLKDAVINKDVFFYVVFRMNAQNQFYLLD